MGTLRFSLRVLMLLAWTALMLTAVETHQLFVPAGARRQVFARYRRRWCRGWLWIFGADLRLVTAAPAPQPGRGRLIIANHRAFLDIPILLAHVDGAFLSRADVATWPLFGRAARKAETVFVDRSRRESGSAAVRAMRERLAEGGSVLIFPEGTTFAGDELRPLKPGGFAAAHGLPADVVGAGLAYAPGTEMGELSTLRHLFESGRRRRTALALTFGAPVAATADSEAMAAAGAKELARLIARSRAALQEG